MTDRATTWLIIGFVGQAVFTARFVVQWVESERKRDSVVPIAFWWLSLLGGGLLLAYACSRKDPVIILGQSLGVFVYTRNLMLVKKNRLRIEKARRRTKAVQGVVATDFQACPVCRKAA